jgi:phosphoglycolate phosphatase
MAMSKSYRLLIFDWDGTLMDSEARIVTCMQAALADAVCTPVSRCEIREVIGLGLPEAVATLLPDEGSARHEAVAARYRHHFLSARHQPSRLFPGTADTLRRLRGRGYLLAVATGKGRRGLDAVLRATGLRRLFHATRCADETVSKPHPQMLWQIIDELDVEADQSLMIGDTEFDMQMARNARVAALSVGYGVHPPERLLRHGPVGCIQAIEQLPKWLEDHCLKRWTSGHSN